MPLCAGVQQPQRQHGSEGGVIPNTEGKSPSIDRPLRVVEGMRSGRARRSAFPAQAGGRKMNHSRHGLLAAGAEGPVRRRRGCGLGCRRVQHQRGTRVERHPLADDPGRRVVEAVVSNGAQSSRQDVAQVADAEVIPKPSYPTTLTKHKHCASNLHIFGGNFSILVMSETAGALRKSRCQNSARSSLFDPDDRSVPI